MTNKTPAPRTNDWCEHPDLIAFFTAARNRPDDLYASERKFIPWLAARAERVLDVGCAAGGFKDIWRHFRPGIEYIGADRSTGLVDAARRQHPDGHFLVGDCVAGLPLPDRHATVVQALGWLHWEPKYAFALRELWRLTDRFCFFDVRLRDSEEDAQSGWQQVAYSGAWDGQTATPYVVLGWPAFARLLLDLGPDRIYGYGYDGAVPPTVAGTDPRVCFAAFVLEKPAPGVETSTTRSACLDLPLRWPASLADRVTMVSGSELNALLA